MCGCYEVKPEDVEFLSAHLAGPVQLDFSARAYFVEADAAVRGCAGAGQE
jgi:hypothetical protein